MAHSCENCKANPVDIAEKTTGTPTAKLIAILIAHGITDTKRLAEITGLKIRAVQTAKSAAQCAQPTAPAQHNASRSAAQCAEAQHNAPSAAHCAQHTAQPSRVENIIINTLGEGTGESIVITPCIPQAAAEPVAEPVIAKPKPNRQRGTRLDREWHLPADWRMWARTNFPASTDEQVTSQADQFRDYWISKPGAIACKLDWEATWRNWCRKGLSAAGMVRQPQYTGSFKPKFDWSQIEIVDREPPRHVGV